MGTIFFLRSLVSMFSSLFTSGLTPYSSFISTSSNLKVNYLAKHIPVPGIQIFLPCCANQVASIVLFTSIFIQRLSGREQYISSVGRALGGYLPKGRGFFLNPNQVEMFGFRLFTRNIIRNHPSWWISEGNTKLLKFCIPGARKFRGVWNSYSSKRIRGF